MVPTVWLIRLYWERLMKAWSQEVSRFYQTGCPILNLGLILGQGKGKLVSLVCVTDSKQHITR